MPDLQFGLTFFSGTKDVREVERLEDLGYDSVWASEHIFFYSPTFDALSVLAAFAARTTRIRLGTAVYLLPLRPAAVTAKQATSVDILSNGRLILGIGVGGEYPKEFQAVGVPVEERGARSNEAIRVLKRLWNEDEVTYKGRFSTLDGVRLQPKPAQPGGPPIWVAGRSDAAIRRAGRLGDGYFPYLFSPDRYKSSLQQVRQEAEKAGRDPDAITPALYQFICLADSYEGGKRIAAAHLSRTYNQPFENIVERYVVMGTADDCVRRLSEFADAGVKHFVLVSILPEGEQLMTHIAAYAKDIIPKLKGA